MSSISVHAPAYGNSLWVFKKEFSSCSDPAPPPAPGLNFEPRDFGGHPTGGRLGRKENTGFWEEVRKGVIKGAREEGERRKNVWESWIC